MAAPSVRLHPDTIAEAKAAYDWYAKRNPTAANAFISELDHAISQIQKGPERFPYAVVYRITQSTIQLIAVAHGRRRPGYWKSRRFEIG